LDVCYLRLCTVLLMFVANNVEVFAAQYMSSRNLLVPAPESSWRRVFDPVSSFCLILYHYLEQTRTFGLVPENQF